jgi:GR25 family glycosyltransferase involved in LPS biosynthesis
MTIDTIQKLCLSLPEKPERKRKAQEHFDANGLHGVTFLTSIHGERFGLKTIFPYAVDDPSGNFFCGHHETGIFLSHYIAWQIAALGHGPVMILEDDAKLEPGWKESTQYALRDAPLNTDFIFVGHCGAAGAMKDHVAGNLWNVRWPSCFHCYLIWPEAARYMMETMRKMFGPVDLMTFVQDPRGGSTAPFKNMKVLTILPRKVSQFNTEIPD